MSIKSFAACTICVCLVAVVAATWSQYGLPRSAEAGPTSLGATAACRVVIGEIGRIERFVLSEQLAKQIQPLAVMDVLVLQESRIDTSRCPSDFRMAVMRFVAAEAKLDRDAHMNVGKQWDDAARFFFAVLDRGSKSPYEHKDAISDEKKRDIDDIQSALLGLEQTAMKYGVK